MAFGVHRYVYQAEEVTDPEKLPKQLMKKGAICFMELWNFSPLGKGGTERTILWSQICWQ